MKNIKNVTLILFVFLGFSAKSQKYYLLEVDTSNAADSCGLTVKVKKHNLTGFSQYVMSLYPATHAVSNSSELSNVCRGAKVSVDLMDSTCVFLQNMLLINENISEQITVDTIMITMPSSPGSCDGSISFQFNNVGAMWPRSWGSTSGGGGTTDSTFTGLCEDRYFYGITMPGHTSYDFYITIDLFLTPWLPCDPFDVSVTSTPSGSPGICDGSVVVMPSTGLMPNYNYYISNEFFMVNTSTSENFANDLCFGKHLIYIEQSGNVYKYLSKAFYIDTLIPDSTWGAPPVIPPSVDTITLPSLYNCEFNFTQPIDTAYITNITSSSPGFYDFHVIIVQGSDTIILNESSLLDTTTSYFIDVTLYCDDTTLSTRAPGKFAMRNFIYQGEQFGLNVSENVNVFDLTIFPNPVTDQLFIDGMGKTVTSLEVFSLSGDLIYVNHNPFGKKALDMSSWPPSVYVLKYNVQHEKSGIIRVVKL